MNKKIGLTAIAGAMALAACGQGPNQTPTQPQDRTLTVNVIGLAEGVQAPVTITNTATNSQVQSFNLRGSRAVQLPQGNYRVAVGEVANYTTTIREANVALTQDDRLVTFEFAAVPVTPGPGTPAPAPRVPARVDLWNGGNPVLVGTAPNRQAIALRDERGRPLPGRYEADLNPNKEAYLFVAQTEEEVCATVRVVDAAGNAVANTRVTVNVTSATPISLAPGCTAAASGVATPLATATQVITTDAQGIARFRLESGFQTGFDTNFIGSGLFDDVKVFVQADNGAGVSTPSLEFKMLFMNISHLNFRLSNVEGAANPRTFQAPFRLSEGTRNTAAAGQPANGGNVFTFEDFGTMFPTRADGTLAPARLETLVRQKQPTSPLFPPQSRNGFVIYTLEGPDANLVSINGQAGGARFIDRTGAGIVLTPLIGAARLNERPLDVNVRATYVVSVPFGTQDNLRDAIFEFALKDYELRTRATSPRLNITKSINNRVLTWAGPARTLGATGAITREPYVARVTIRSQNAVDPANLLPGEVAAATATNVVLRDVLPPELGYAGNASIRIVNRAGTEVARYAVPPEAVTYDATLHAVTINSIVVGGAAQPINLQAGETAEFNFDVYARQKPGFAWNALRPRTEDGAVPLSATQRRNFVNGVDVAGPVINDTDANIANRPYADPYRVTNGEQPQSVSVSYTVPGQNTPAVVYYEATGEESDIWVVRPIYQISKVVDSNVRLPVPVGAQVPFNITVTHVDRVAYDRARRIEGTFNRLEIGYDTLAARFPFEFDPTTPSRPSPLSNPPSAVEVVRNNPYIRGLTVEDQFENSLDFVRGTAFTRFTGLPTPNQVAVGKQVSWTLGEEATEAQLQRGQSTTAQIFLTANRATQEGLPAILNCARLTAPQLNQPRILADGRTVDASRGPQTSYVPRIPWRQDLPLLSGWTEVTSADVQANPTNPYLRANALISCAGITVEQRPIFRLALSNHAEFINANPFLNEAERRDIYSVGENFFLKYTIDNSEVGAATGVTFTVVRQDDRAVWIPGALATSATPEIAAYRNVGSTFAPNWVLIAAPGRTDLPGRVTVSGNTVTFTNITIPGRDPNVANSRGEVRFVLGSTAQRVGTSEVVATATAPSATVPGTTTDLGPVREETTIIR